MKKHKLFSKRGGMGLTGVVLIASLLSSCLKDNGPGSIDFSQSPALVAFQYQAGSAIPYVEAMPNKTTTLTNVEVTLSVASITLKTPVTAQIALDPDGETAYIDTDLSQNGRVDHVLPASDYTIANGGKVTISPGQQIVKIPITYQGAAIDFSQNYILGLKLTDASGATLTANLNNAILVITLKSIYQAEYTVTGSFVDHESSAITDAGVYPETVALVTQGAYSVAAYDISHNLGYFVDINSGGSNAAYYGNFDPIFNFDTNGNITSVVNYYGQGTNSQARSAELDASGQNKVLSGTPGTSGFSFQVSYILVQSGIGRTYFNETYTYAGPY